MARSRNRLILAAMGMLVLIAGVTSATAANAQADTETLSVSITVEPSNTELAAYTDAVTLTAVVTNAPAGITPTYSWEWRTSGRTEWEDAYYDKPVLRWLEASTVDVTREIRVTVSYGPDNEATSDHVTVMWTGVTPPTAAPCTVTTTIAKPTGLTLTVNPDSYSDSGILLSWDPPATTDEVELVNIFRREVIEGTATSLELHIPISGFGMGTTPWTQADATEIDFADDPAGNLTDGSTYAYALQTHRTDNCFNLQASEMSDEVSVTYTAPVAGMSGDGEDDEFVGGL